MFNWIHIFNLNPEDASIFSIQSSIAIAENHLDNGKHSFLKTSKSILCDENSDITSLQECRDCIDKNIKEGDFSETDIALYYIVYSGLDAAFNIKILKASSSPKKAPVIIRHIYADAIQIVVNYNIYIELMGRDFCGKVSLNDIFFGIS